MQAAGFLAGRFKSGLTRFDLREHEDKILLLLAFVVSAVVGLVVVAFVAVTERLGSLLLTLGAPQRFFSPLAGSLIGGWLLFKYFPEARGSGIPQTRIALVLHKGRIGLRTVVGKFLCSSISLGSGVALGREGPSVHIGAGIASTAARRLGLRDEHVRALIPVGTAAAVAAAFNTPLAAVLFTLEEILADLEARVVGPVVIGAATSWVVLRVLLGDEPLFHVPAYQLVHPAEFLVYAVLGLLGALVSTAFVKMLLWQRTAFLKAPRRWQPFTPAAGGLVVGLLALAVPGVLGVGYNLVSDALNGRMALQMMLLLLGLKLVATTTSYGSGNAGGIFGPALFIGAMLGGSVGHVAHSLWPDHTGNAGAYALVGMGAAFAGIVRTPMTSVVMIFEVTRDYSIIVPLMIANLCSYVLARKFQRQPVYEALARQDGIEMPSPEHLPEPLTVAQAMRRQEMPSPVPPGLPYAHADDPLDAALQRMGRAGLEEIPIAGRAGEGQVGTLGGADALGAYRRLAGRGEAPKPPGQSTDWLPALAAISVAAVLLGSGLILWQRARRADTARQAYGAGVRLMAQGQVEDAVASFRTAVAEAPGDVRVRAALGLALVRSGHSDDALSYLTGALESDPHNGPVRVGLAEIALARGDRSRALEMLRQALSKDWPAAEEPHRREAQLHYASLLAEAGRRAEAVAVLMSVIERHGDEPSTGLRAADSVRSIGSAGQAEEAYAALAGHFPADARIWIRLGQVRYDAGSDAAALAAFRQAEEVDPANAEARGAATRLEEILSLDPTRRGLTVRARAGRWAAVLDRVLAAAAACGPSREADQARPLLRQHAASLEASDRKMEAALRVWKSTTGACRGDAALAHIMAKLGE